jgi:hypothetical protein
MANERKPSIFNDRSSIGSEKELDEYGVWVKSESEEFSVSERDNSFEADFPPFDEGDGSIEGIADGADAEPTLKTARLSQTNADVTLSAALLLKIAEELATVKAELVALKAELDRIHKEGVKPASEQPTPATPQTAPSVREPAADTIPAIEEPIDEIFGGEAESFGEENALSGELEETAEAGFFETNGIDEDSDTIALTSDELDLLSEAADESVEEMEDSFFAEDDDQEKIAFTGDEMNNILESADIPSEADDELAIDKYGLEQAADEPDESFDTPVAESETEEPFAEEKTIPETGFETGESHDFVPEKQPGESFDTPVAESEAEEPFAEEKTIPETGFETDESHDFVQEKQPDEPKVEEETPQVEYDPDDTFDINIETAGESLSEDALIPEDADTEITLDEESLDEALLNLETDGMLPETEQETADIIDEESLDEAFPDVETDGMLPETESGLDEESLDEARPDIKTGGALPETADIVDDDVWDIEPDAEESQLEDSAMPTNTEDELEESAPEAADIAFDPFGSLPDEDVLDEDSSVGKEGLVDIDGEGDPFAELSDKENDQTADDDPFADFPSRAEPLAEDASGEPVITEEITEIAEDEDDPFADFSAGENAEFDETITVETAETAITTIEDTAKTDGEPVLEDRFEPQDDGTVLGEVPELSELTDEDTGEAALPIEIEDTNYLDDEKPVEFDKAAEPNPLEPSDAALPETSPLPEAEPGTDSADEESPVLKGVPREFKQELRSVLSYMDILLESLPEEKIEEFARSEHFESYKRLFKELGLV